MSTSTPLRVRVHLNLANPAQAENVVKVRLPTGTWSTVAYAKELLLENCIPVVDLPAQERVRSGHSRKVPHAYIEADLVHFSGRLRPLAPKRAKELARPHLIQVQDFHAIAAPFLTDPARINYNPRFARCFYLDAPDRALVSERFVASGSMLAIGWSFMARAVQSAPLLPSDRCDKNDLLLASSSEKSVLRRGHEATTAQVSLVAVRRPGGR